MYVQVIQPERWCLRVRGGDVATEGPHVESLCQASPVVVEII